MSCVAGLRFAGVGVESATLQHVTDGQVFVKGGIAGSHHRIGFWGMVLAGFCSS